MNNIIGKHTRSLLSGLALVLFANLAQAQYVWIDAKGVRQFSDKAPPASVPMDKILKAPGGTAAQVPAASPAPAAPAADKAAPPTLADRNADYKKRVAEKAEQDKKAAEEANKNAAQKMNCEAARSYKQQLDSGERIGVMEKNGERGFMDDGARATQRANVNKVLDSCK